LDPRLRTQAKAFAKHLEAALLYADVRTAETIARDAVAAGMSAGLIGDAVVRPAMRRIGDRWARGEITMGEEHVATEIVLRLLVLLREIETLPEQRWNASVLLAALEGERHVVGLTMAADLLEDAGFRVLFAGGDLPLSGLASLLDHHVPDLVAFSATMPSNVITLDPAVRLAQEAGVKGAIAGGAAVEDESHPIPGLHTSDSVQGVVQAADRLLRQAGLN
jgi:MerR family transcriptional regulator, light-induced transcriptional regulator